MHFVINFNHTFLVLHCMFLRLLRPVPLLSLSTLKLPVACVVLLSSSVAPDKTFKTIQSNSHGKMHVLHEHHFRDTVKWEHVSGQVIVYFNLVYLLESILLLHLDFI